MKIGNMEIQGRAALAPMAGVTDAAFRQVCQGFGAAYTITEMVSARAVTYGDKKTAEIASVSQDASPVFIQLFGEDPQTIAQAGEMLRPAGRFLPPPQRFYWTRPIRPAFLL